MTELLSVNSYRRHYWMRPKLTRSICGGGDLLLGPIQINWYNAGLRVHLTWPISKMFTLR